MSHTSLRNYYHLLFSLKQHYNYSISEMEALIPFERDIYVKLLTDYLESIKQENK